MFCEKLKVEKVPEAAKLISDAFPRTGTHSWGRALGLTGSLEPWLLTTLPDQISGEPGCFGAYATESNALIGSVVVEPFHGGYNDQISSSDSLLTSRLFTEPTDALRGLEDGCSQLFFCELKARQPQDFQNLLEHRSKVGYIYWIATIPEYRRSDLHVASALIQRSVLSMFALKYDYAVAYCINPAAAKLFVKNGFEIWNQLEYKEFQMKTPSGEFVNPYTIIPDSVFIVVKKLSN
jgi:ribosomal protein S18 acetylase RimI-like enzyme